MSLFAYASADNATDLVTNTNAVLASLLANTLSAVQFSALSVPRASGAEYFVIVTYQSTGSVITNPYQFLTFAGRNNAEASAALAAYVAANPTAWFGEPILIAQSDERKVRKNIIGVLYNPSSADGTANWTPLGGGGGGGGGAVNSVFGRTGTVVATTGDYTAAQVTNAATAGVNSNITSLTGLLTPLSVGQGGTGSTTAAGARTNLSVYSIAEVNANMFLYSVLFH